MYKGHELIPHHSSGYISWAKCTNKNYLSIICVHCILYISIPDHILVQVIQSLIFGGLLIKTSWKSHKTWTVRHWSSILYHRFFVIKWNFTMRTSYHVLQSLVEHPVCQRIYNTSWQGYKKRMGKKKAQTWFSFCLQTNSNGLKWLRSFLQPSQRFSEEFLLMTIERDSWAYRSEHDQFSPPHPFLQPYQYPYQQAQCQVIFQ